MSRPTERATADSTFIGEPSVAPMVAKARQSPKEMPEAVANLDALRALAVLLVLLDHVLDTISHKHPGISFHPYDWGLGRLGVLLFFVHTSLVLNFSMVRLRLRGWELFESFFIRRAFRLYPLSVFCVLLILALQVPAKPWDEFVWHGWGNALSNLALTMNLTFSEPVLSPLWSLPIEAQMYLVLPIIFLMLGPQRNVALALGLWVLAAVAAFFQPLVSDRLNVVGFSPYFIAGVLAYTLSRRTEARFPAVCWLPFLIGLVVIYLIVQEFLGGIYSRPLQWAFCLLVGILLPRFRDSKSTSLNTAAHLTAKYSYGIYLFHCVALWIACFRLTMLPEFLQWLLMIVLLAGLSIAGFHFIEKPAIDYGARLAAKRSARRSGSTKAAH